MKTTDFLKTFGLEELCARFNIRAKRHTAHPQLVQLKYNQVFSPMAEPIVQECRGLIVDESDDWRVVCRPYDKFFNYGEPNAAAIDWGSAKVYEKLDGSLMTLYYYRDAWWIASSGIPDGAGVVNEAGISFADLFRRTWAGLNYSWPEPSVDPVCYMFEMMTAENRVIVAHAAPRIVLHGVRDLCTMRELDPEPIAAKHGWECARSFPLTSIQDCVTAAGALDPMRGEGYIVRDGSFRRVKVKSPQYVALTHLKGAMTGRRLLEIICSNESDEFLGYFPEFRRAYDAVRREYESLCAELEHDYARLREIAEQKTFATEAMKTRCSSVLFALRGGKAESARGFFADATIQAIERALGMDMGTLIGQPPAEDAGG